MLAVDEVEEDEEDLLRYCRREENVLLQALLEKRGLDLNINYVEEGRYTALNISSQLGNLPAVKMLLLREDIQVGVVQCREELLRQQSYAIKNQLGHPKQNTPILLALRWDSWLPCTERSYYRRPYAIKNIGGYFAFQSP